MSKFTLTTLTTYDVRSGEVVTSICSDVGDSGYRHLCDVPSTPSKLSSVLALSGIEFLLSATAEESGLTSFF